MYDTAGVAQFRFIYVYIKIQAAPETYHKLSLA